MSFLVDATRELNPYRWVMRVRNWLFDTGMLPSYRSALPVISVGNIAVGGSGKTPLTAYLVSELTKQGRSPVILSRGYGGSEPGPLVVSATASSAAAVGDEPLLLARRGFTVVVCRDRVAGAKFIAQQQLGDCIVLDDGHQHRRLAHQVALLAFDCSTAAACTAALNDRTLPFGRNREPLLSGLARADAAVLNARAPQLPNSAEYHQLKSFLSARLPVFESTLTPSIARSAVESEPPRETALHLVAAIANPAGVEQSVAALGYTVTKRTILADHSPAVVQAIEEGLRSSVVVCTEKDAVKLREMPPALLVLRGELAVERGGELLQMVMQRI